MSINVTKEAIQLSLIKQGFAKETDAIMMAAQALACVSKRMREENIKLDKAVYECVKEARS